MLSRMGVGSLAEAEALFEVGRAQDALEVVAAELAARPDDVMALLLATRCHLKLREPGYAVSAATTALGYAPDDLDAMVLTSLAYTAAGDSERAAQHAQQAIEAWPREPGGYQAFAYARLSQKRYAEQVRAAAATVLEMQPLDPDAHVLAARAEMYPGRLRPGPLARRRARAQLLRALELDPTHLTAMQESAALAAMGWGFARGLRGSARVLQTSPFEYAPKGAIAYIFRRLIWLVHILIILAFFGCLFAWLAGTPAAMRAIAGGAALIVALLLVTIRWQLGSSAAAHLRAFPRRDSAGAAWIVALILAVTLLNVGSWVPGAVGLLALAKILIWIGVALSWVPRRFET